MVALGSLKCIAGGGGHRRRDDEETEEEEGERYYNTNDRPVIKYRLPCQLRHQQQRRHLYIKTSGSSISSMMNDGDVGTHNDIARHSQQARRLQQQKNGNSQATIVDTNIITNSNSNGSSSRHNIATTMKTRKDKNCHSPPSTFLGSFRVWGGDDDDKQEDASAGRVSGSDAGHRRQQHTAADEHRDDVHQKEHNNSPQQPAARCDQRDDEGSGVLHNNNTRATIPDEREEDTQSAARHESSSSPSHTTSYYNNIVVPDEDRDETEVHSPLYDHATGKATRNLIDEWQWPHQSQHQQHSTTTTTTTTTTTLKDEKLTTATAETAASPMGSSATPYSSGRPSSPQSTNQDHHSFPSEMLDEFEDFSVDVFDRDDAESRGRSVARSAPLRSQNQQQEPSTQTAHLPFHLARTLSSATNRIKTVRRSIQQRRFLVSVDRSSSSVSINSSSSSRSQMLEEKAAAAISHSQRARYANKMAAVQEKASATEDDNNHTSLFDDCVRRIERYEPEWDRRTRKVLDLVTAGMYNRAEIQATKLIVEIKVKLLSLRLDNIGFTPGNMPDLYYIRAMARMGGNSQHSAPLDIPGAIDDATEALELQTHLDRDEHDPTTTTKLLITRGRGLARLGAWRKAETDFRSSCSTIRTQIGSTVWDNKVTDPTYMQLVKETLEVVTVQKLKDVRPHYSKEEKDTLQRELGIGPYRGVVYKCHECGAVPESSGDTSSSASSSKPQCQLTRCDQCERVWFCSQACKGKALKAGHREKCKAEQYSYNFLISSDAEKILLEKLVEENGGYAVISSSRSSGVVSSSSKTEDNNRRTISSTNNSLRVIVRDHRTGRFFESLSDRDIYFRPSEDELINNILITNFANRIRGQQ